ncbi:MAG: S1C family serine protease [Candidatus Moraniibacteriota bacterium]
MFPPSIKKIFRIALVVAGIFVLGGFGGVVFDRYVIPYLSSVPFLANRDVFKALTERVTVINKTEQVVIREDDSVEKIVSQPATAVVSIVVLADENDVATKEAATMTGVLLTNDGLIVTYSDKPLGGGNVRYSALLFDGSSHPADVVGYDSLTNLSFFRLNDTVNTPAIAFANSDDARVGKKLITVGKAFAEYQNRLSVGILGNINHTFNLSGKTVSSSEKWEGVFEMDFDASENFIGGPAVGFNGEMVGLVGALTIDNAVKTFLVPSNAVRASLDRAIHDTLAKRPILGAYYLPITQMLAVAQGLPRDRGALIYSPSGKTGLALIADSPAMRSGLLVGDIIMAVNGTDVSLDNPLPKLLSRFDIGDTIELSVFRKGTDIRIPITL